MKPPKTDRRVARTIDLYEKALIRLLEKKDINDITVTDLCTETGLTRSTFYNHYNDVYDLLETIQDKILGNLVQIPVQKSSDTPDGNKAAILFLLEYIGENADAFRVLLNDNGNLRFFAKMKTNIAQALDNMEKDAKEQPAPLHTRIVLSFMFTGMLGIIRDWLKNNMQPPAPEMAEILYTISKSLYKTKEEFYERG